MLCSHAFQDVVLTSCDVYPYRAVAPSILLRRTVLSRLNQQLNALAQQRSFTGIVLK